MKNKILFCACALALVVAMFTACEKQVDVEGLTEQVAQKTMLGMYSYMEVDTANMAVIIKEWTLADDTVGRHGSYRVASTGNGLDENSTTELTWVEAIKAEDGLSMTIPITLASGEKKELVWANGVVSVDDYTTEKSIISMGDVLRTTNDNFSNTSWAFNDTTSYITSRQDTMKYLAWKTAVVSYTQEQIDSAKQAMIDYRDTLLWFNATYPSRAVPDTVRFSTKPQTDGTYKGQVSIPYEDMEIKTIKTNHGPLKIINSTMDFNRDAALANTGKFFYREQNWNEIYYDDPTSSEAKYSDSIVDLNNMKWTPCSFNTIKKFNVLIKQDDELLELPLSGFVKKDSVIVYNEHKYKLQ